MWRLISDKKLGLKCPSRPGISIWSSTWRRHRIHLSMKLYLWLKQATIVKYIITYSVLHYCPFSIRCSIVATIIVYPHSAQIPYAAFRHVQGYDISRNSTQCTQWGNGGLLLKVYKIQQILYKMENIKMENIIYSTEVLIIVFSIY